MRILLIGANGSIGSRYAAIFRYMGIKYTPIEVWDRLEDVVSDNRQEYTYALIASPTETHIEFCNRLLTLNIPFLCEKPLTQDLEEAKDLMDRVIKEGATGRCHVVCNYEILFRSYSPMDEISYNYYKTGPDGMLWDCCQLLYYAYKNEIECHIFTDSPVWTLEVDGEVVPYRDIEESYVDMIRCWLRGSPHVWTLADGYEMTRLVKEQVDACRNIDSSALKQYTLSR